MKGIMLVVSPDTITVGTNELIGRDPKNIAPAMKPLFAG